MRVCLLLCCVWVGVLCLHAQTPVQIPRDGIVYPGGGPAQTETDEYTRYELLAPETASFRIFYEVTATTAGAKYFYNPIRKGSVATDESVTDAMTGKPLAFTVVSGEEARKDPLMASADPQTSFIRVTLARPVPEHGQARLVILKTYMDAKSYSHDGSTIYFTRPLGIRRNKIVLPPGYEVVGLSVPSQIGLTPDGLVAVSFMNGASGEAPLAIRAAKDAPVGKTAEPYAPGSKPSWESPFPGPSERARLSERAHQDREIVYFLQQPETHAFALYHDYTESRAGVNAYANVVRTGSKASDPSAYVLDTGEKLQTQVMTGAAMKAAKLNAGEDVEDGATVVVIPFRAVVAGESRRLRISETYTDAVSYRVDGDEFTFDRSLGRPRNTVVLPSGWYCTASAEPATVTQTRDGRVRLEFWDGQPEGVDVLVKGRRMVENAAKRE